MKTHLPFHGIIFTIIFILVVNFNRLSAQQASVNSSSIISKSVVSLNGEWLFPAFLLISCKIEGNRI